MANEYAINIVTHGGQQAGNAIRKVASDIGVSTADIKKRMKETGQSWEDATKSVLTGSDKATKATDNYRDSLGRLRDANGKFIKDTDKTGDSLKKTGSAFESAESKAKKYWQSIDEARAKTENLQRSAETVRNFGVGMAAAGAGGLILANSLIEVFNEGERAVAKLDAMLKKRGEGGRFEEMTNWAGKLAHEAALVDDDPINEAAAGLLGFGLNADQIRQIMPGLIGQSRLYGQSLESISEAFGRAYASGNAGALKRSGVTISQAEIDHIADATSETEKQARMFEAVKRSMEQYALSITEGMSEAEIAANRMALATDTAMSNVGKGAADAKKAVDELGASIITLGSESPALQKTMGGFLYIGSLIATTTGTMVGFVAQIGLAKMAFPGMAVTGSTAFAAIGTAAKATGVAIYAALAPILPLVLAIAAVMAAITAGAVYLQKRAQQQAIAEGDAVDKEYYERFGKKDMPGLSFEQWKQKTGRGAENSEDFSDATNVQAALENAQKMAASPVPALASSQVAGMQIIAPESTPPATAATATDAISTGSKKGDAAAKKSAKEAEREAEKAAKQLEKDMAAEAKTQQRLNAVFAARGINLATVDIDAINDQLATETDESKKAGLNELKRIATRYQSNARRQESAAEKEKQRAHKIEERIARSGIAVGTAIIEERFALAAARLEAMKGSGKSAEAANAKIDYQRAQLEAQKVKELAQLEAKYSDSFIEGGGLKIAGLKSQGILARAAIALQKAGGGGIGNKPRNSGISGALGEETTYMGRKYFGSAKSFGLQGLGTTLQAANWQGRELKPLAGSGRRGNQQVMAKVASTAYTNDGQWIEVLFEKIRFPNPAAQMARARR
jgi:hypothetical protein